MLLWLVTLWTQDNIKLLQQLKSGFKLTINWNKYQSKAISKNRNPYLDFLIDPGFQGANRILALSCEDNKTRQDHTGYLHPKVEILWLIDKTFSISQYKKIWEHIITFEKYDRSIRWLYN